MAVIDSRKAGYMQASEEATLDPVDAIRKHVSGITGLPLHQVRYAWSLRTSKQPPMSETWCSVELLKVRREGGPYFKRREGERGDGEASVINWQTLPFLIVFRGPEADRLSDLFCMGTQLSQHQSELFKDGLKIRSVDPEVTIIPELYGNEWIRRYDVSLEVARAVSRSYGIRKLVSADFQLVTEKGDYGKPKTVNAEFKKNKRER